MKNRRVILFLLAVIAALVAANLALDQSGVGTGLVQRRTLLSEAREATRLTLARRGAPPLVLADTNGDWRIVAPFCAPAARAAVLQLTDALANAPVADQLTYAEILRLGRTRADFALDEPRVVLSLETPRAQHVVSFGLATPDGKGVYATVEGVDTVFIAPSNALAFAERPADAFRRRAFFPIGAESVVSFDLVLPGAPSLSFVRSGDTWRSGEARVVPEKVNRFLVKLLSSEAQSFVWPVGATNEATTASSPLLAVYGLDAESVSTVILRGSDGRERRIGFGLEAGEKRVYALVQDGGAIVTADAALAETVSRALASFTDARLFPLEAKSVAAFSVSDGTTTCRLARDAQGTWRLDAPVAAPADAAQAEALLGRLLTLTDSDLDPRGLTVQVATNVAPTAVATARALGSAHLDDLRAKEIVRIDPAHVTRLVATFGAQGAQPTSVVRAPDRRAWNALVTDGSAVPDAQTVERVLKVLDPLVAVRVARLQVRGADLVSFGLDHPFFTLAVDQDREDAVRRNILIGAKTKEGYFATVGSSEAVFVISQATVAALTRALTIPAK